MVLFKGVTSKFLGNWGKNSAPFFNHHIISNGHFTIHEIFKRKYSAYIKKSVYFLENKGSFSGYPYHIYEFCSI